MTHPIHLICAGLVALAFAAPQDALASSAMTDAICADKSDMTARLRNQYGSEKQGAGLHGPDEMVEIWSSSRTGDWALVRTYARGISCIIAMGEHWAETAPRDPA